MWKRRPFTSNQLKSFPGVAFPSPERPFRPQVPFGWAITPLADRRARANINVISQRREDGGPVPSQTTYRTRSTITPLSPRRPCTPPLPGLGVSVPCGGLNKSWMLQRQEEGSSHGFDWLASLRLSYLTLS